MITHFIPKKISSRIVALILFILLSNAVLTGIFSRQYHMRLGQVKSGEAIEAIINYLTIHHTPQNIGKVLDSFDIEHLEVVPSTIAPTDNVTLRRIADEFNKHHPAKLVFYEDATESKLLYIAYKDNNKPIYWMTMPHQPIEKNGIIIAYLEEIMIILIILVGSYTTARTINAPLRTIKTTLKEFGLGLIPPPIEIDGPTEIKQLAKCVNQMVQNQYNLEKERELMLAGISHDIRTPLARLELLVEMSSASEETIASIKDEIDQITKMQQQFIDYVSASNHEPEEEIYVTGFCSDLVNKYKLLNQIITINDKASTNLHIKTQPIGLYRILMNAINNAIKYGEPPFMIEITQTAHDVTINILDHGSGVSEETSREMFKPLYRGNNARKNADGSGLGLAIVDRIIKRLGGKIHAYNIEPKGFCLSITLPLTSH